MSVHAPRNGIVSARNAVIRLMLASLAPHWVEGDGPSSAALPPLMCRMPPKADTPGPGREKRPRSGASFLSCNQLQPASLLDDDGLSDAAQLPSRVLHGQRDTLGRIPLEAAFDDLTERGAGAAQI